MNGADRTADRVLVLGGGPAGVACAQKLGDEGIDVVLVDRNDYHQFQPLLYQVASSQLPAEDIARPHRVIFADYPSVTLVTAHVSAVTLSPPSVVLSDGRTLTGSYLVMAAGAQPNFFGVPGAAEHAFPLYSVADAERLRIHLQHLLQEAMAGRGSPEPGALDVVVVGGGPTGVETTGALAELMQALQHTGRLDPAGKITIVDRSPALLGQFSARRTTTPWPNSPRSARTSSSRSASPPSTPTGSSSTTTPRSRREPWCGAAGNRPRRSHTRPARSSAAADGSTSGPT